MFNKFNAVVINGVRKFEGGITKPLSLLNQSKRSFHDVLDLLYVPKGP